MIYVTDAEMSLYDAVCKMAPESSKTTCRSWIKEGRITVDGKPRDLGTFALKEGQKIALQAKPRFAAKSELPIVYQDQHLVVIDKPAGLLSVATDFEKEKTAHAMISRHFPSGKVHVVHRLDQDTSGLMMFALTDQARDQLKAGFEDHSIQRSYTALVEGVISGKMGTWTSYQYEDARYHVHNTQDPTKGVEAITHYEVKGRSKTSTWLELELETGRKNQIRAHCQMVGYPILGDTKYGATRDPLKRLALHARELRFDHPRTGKPMKFVSNVPESFHRLIKVRRPTRAS